MEDRPAVQKEKGLIRDLTVGSVPSTLLRFALPLFFSGLLQTLYNMVDMIIVGNYVGPAGLAAVSVGGDLLMLFTFVAMGCSNAGQVLISRYVGENRKDLVGKMVGTLFTVLLAASVAAMTICLVFHNRILSWLNTPEDSWDMAVSYVVTCACGMVFIYGYNLVSAILRGMGDSKHPFIFIAIASVINLILDIVFVIGLKLGPFGAALGTVIGQGISFLFALRLLYKNRESFEFSFRLKDFKIHPEVAKPLAGLGIPMVIQSAAINFSMLFVNSYVYSYGVEAVAVTGVARKLESIINVIAQAISSAGGAMIAQALGARKLERVPKVVANAMWIVFIPSLVMAFITLTHPEWLYGLFTDDAAVLALALTYVPVAMIQYAGAFLRPPFFALINGSGNSKLNLAVALLDGIFCRIGLALLLGVTLNWGIRGFWYGNAISGTVPFYIGIVYLLSGRWKNRASQAPEEDESTKNDQDTTAGPAV
ncbi:MAG: MATE family efflux transporter [Lachnospiraceae bacterium]|nr:MATE family efflux transporter [Lachnospiraceae bacterium]